LLLLGPISIGTLSATVWFFHRSALPVLHCFCRYGIQKKWRVWHDERAGAREQRLPEGFADPFAQQELLRDPESAFSASGEKGDVWREL
jgi:hypothetical protein